MLRLGWFSTGRGEGSRGLFTCVKDAIDRGELAAEIAFVFCNRDAGEHSGSDAYMEMVRSHGIPVIALSSQGFRRERGSARFAEVREAYDDATLALLDGYAADLHVTAGYGLIFGPAMVASRPGLNLHPASPDGPVGTWAAGHLAAHRVAGGGIRRLHAPRRRRTWTEGRSSPTSPSPFAARDSRVPGRRQKHRPCQSCRRRMARKPRFFRPSDRKASSESGRCCWRR